MGEIGLEKNTLVKILLAFVLVLSITLPLASPLAQAAKKVSYLMNTKKGYLYNNYGLAFIEKDGEYDTWLLSCADGYDNFSYKETKTGLYLYNIKILAYPIKKNKKWTENGTTYKITSINKTVKVKAGTFKNVVEVKQYSKGSKAYVLEYYAPNIGLILAKENNKETKYKTKTYAELIKLTDLQ